MGSIISLVAIALPVLLLIGIYQRRQAKRKQKEKPKKEEAPKAVNDRLTYAQLGGWTSSFRVPFETRVGLLFDIPDSTQVEGFISELPAPHIPRGTRRAAMFGNRSIVLCLSEDKRTMLHQRLKADGRYLLHFIVSAGDRDLEETFTILSSHARDSEHAIPRRRVH